VGWCGVTSCGISPLNTHVHSLRPPPPFPCQPNLVGIDLATGRVVSTATLPFAESAFVGVGQQLAVEPTSGASTGGCGVCGEQQPPPPTPHSLRSQVK
jgi:hypothetical protein